MKITERLNVLRELMKEKKIDAYLVPTDDFHGSEYVGDYFKCRKYITGFTGSAGTAVIMPGHGWVVDRWRYFIQAADQLRGVRLNCSDRVSREYRRYISFWQKSWKKVCVWALMDVQSVQKEQKNWRNSWKKKISHLL